MECHPPRPDPSSEIVRLKNQPGKDLIKYGTSRFDDTLVRDQLIDEFRFWIRPVVAGAGQRLFEDVDTSVLYLRLTDERRLRPVSDEHEIGGRLASLPDGGWRDPARPLAVVLACSARRWGSSTHCPGGLRAGSEAEVRGRH
jgi:RibD C-terminal domain